MITAVDTNILLDILIPDAPEGETSQRSLETALQLSWVGEHQRLTSTSSVCGGSPMMVR